MSMTHALKYEKYCLLFAISVLALSLSAPAQAGYLIQNAPFTVSGDNFVTAGPSTFGGTVQFTPQSIGGTTLVMQEIPVSPGTEWVTFDFMTSAGFFGDQPISGDFTAIWNLFANGVPVSGSPTLSQIIFDFGSTPGDL